MKQTHKLVGALILCASLAGCTVIEENNTGTCSVHDYKGRKWAADGPRACRIALHRCQRWHRRHHPNANWACMYK